MKYTNEEYVYRYGFHQLKDGSWKRTCYKCERYSRIKTAVWHYMPMSDRSEEETFLCDKCVPRGCSCNAVLDDAGNFVEPYQEEVDEQGREYPCCEYMFCADGFSY